MISFFRPDAVGESADHGEEGHAQQQSNHHHDIRCSGFELENVLQVKQRIKTARCTK